MSSGDPCPECTHVDGDIYCDCEACLNDDDEFYEDEDAEEEEDDYK